MMATKIMMATMVAITTMVTIALSVSIAMLVWIAMLVLMAMIIPAAMMVIEASRGFDRPLCIPVAKSTQRTAPTSRNSTSKRTMDRARDFW